MTRWGRCEEEDFFTIKLLNVSVSSLFIISEGLTFPNIPGYKQQATLISVYYDWKWNSNFSVEVLDLAAVIQKTIHGFNTTLSFRANLFHIILHYDKFLLRH